MKENMLISFPRSGRQWTIQRIKTLIELAGPDLWAKPKFLWMNHLGFNPENPSEGIPFDPQIQKTQKVFVLLRAAQKSLTSNYFFILAHDRMAQKLNNRDVRLTNDVDFYLKSSYGVEKFINFLARIQQLKEKRQLTGVLYYEDIHDHTFFLRVPELLGSDYVVSEEMALAAHEASLARVNTFGTDHSLPKEESLEYVQKRLSEKCVLNEYRDRYLKDYA